MKLKQKIKLNGIGLMATIGSLMIVNCGSRDTRNLPNNIRVKSLNSNGYHAHARMVFNPTNPIKFICTGIFGEGLKTKEYIFNDISESGVELNIKKKVSGICGYKFNALSIECSKSPTYFSSDDPPPEKIILGLLDTSVSAATFEGNTFVSPNKILNNILHIEISGEKSRFWGCNDDCENKEDFGLNNSNQTLTINCQDGK